MNNPGHVRRVGAAATVLIVGALFAGCATSLGPALYSAGGNLQARIYEPTAGMVQFAVSQPAYVAVLALVPGRGVTLLHPTTQREALRRVSPGTHTYVASNLPWSRLTYASGRSYYGSSMDGPTTLILIASSEPLNVSRMLGNPMLGSDLTLTSFYTHASDRAVLRLAELMIPDPETTEWTYDTYTIWPNGTDRRIASYRVRCADGQVVVVARGAYPVGCAEGVRQPPGADTAAVPSDSGSVVSPRRPPRRGEPSRAKPGSTVGARTSGSRNGDAPLRAGSVGTRESRAREAPVTTPRPADARTAPPRERQQARPARERPAEKSERSDRSRRMRPGS